MTQEDKIIIKQEQARLNKSLNMLELLLEKGVVDLEVPSEDTDDEAIAVALKEIEKEQEERDRAQEEQESSYEESYEDSYFDDNSESSRRQSTLRSNDIAMKFEESEGDEEYDNFGDEEEEEKQSSVQVGIVHF
jgi:hypothetical protein